MLTTEQENSGATERENGGALATERANDETIGNETAPMVQSTSGTGGKSKGKSISGGTAAKREKKEALVSYSSQDSNCSLLKATSRRSGRKRTPVTKMGAL